MPAWPEHPVYIGSHTERMDAPAKVSGRGQVQL